MGHPLGEGLPAELSPALSGRHQLQLPLDNQLISFPTPTAGGYAPIYAETVLDSPKMSVICAAVRQVLTGHEPYPAVAVDRGWNLVDANASVISFIEGAAPELLTPPINVLRLSLHPGGMAPRILNLGEWRAHLLGRLRRQIDLTADAELAGLYSELRAYPCDQAQPEPERVGAGDIVIPLRIGQGEREFAFFSTVTTFGTPLDITVAELAIESFFPADDRTAAVLRALPASAMDGPTGR